MDIEEIWEDGNEIYFRDNMGNVGQVYYGWEKGCQDCADYEDEITDIMQEEGVLAACRFALEHLTSGLCKKCLEHRKEEET